MFYQNTIKDLRASLRNTEISYNAVKSSRDYLDAALDQKKAELSVVQEAYSNRMKELDELHEKTADLEGKNSTLSFEVADARIENNDLRQKNRELEYQNGLLVSVLQQLRIPVKLPARKS